MQRKYLIKKIFSMFSQAFVTWISFD